MMGRVWIQIDRLVENLSGIEARGWEGDVVYIGAKYRQPNVVLNEFSFSFCSHSGGFVFPPHHPSLELGVYCRPVWNEMGTAMISPDG